jgi:multidrug efflux system membrane fusion protein
MRAFYSYGVALLIVLIVAVWMGTGTLVIGGNGPGKGERPVVSLVEKNGGPLTTLVADSGADHPAAEGAEPAEDPALTIAQRNDQAGNGATAAPRSVRIETLTAQPMPIEVDLRGLTKPESQVTVVAQTAGTVTKVDVEKGQTVKAGDLLCTLDQGSRQAAVTQAQAAVDQAQTAYDSNQALVKKGLAATNTSLALESALKGAKAQLQNAQIELDRTQIKSDIAGVVQAPVASVGSTLAMGGPCATVVQLDPMLFTGSVPEARMAAARIGLKATVKTVTGATAEGKVTYIASTADPATRTFPVEIEIPNPDGKILGGVTADATVEVGVAPAHLLPQSVLTLDDDGVLGIRTVENGNTVAFHPVNIVKDTTDGVWVVGLPTKINVITVGQEYVKSGEIVDARTAEGDLPS